MKEAIVAFCVALVIGAAINGWQGAGGNASPSPEEQKQQATSPDAVDLSSITETSDGQWDTDVLQSNTPVLVDFYMDNCATCKQMTPIVAKVAGEYQGKIKVFRCNVESNPSVIARYSVQTMPTLLIFKGGKMADSYTGIIPETALKQAIDKVASDTDEKSAG